jgi:ubiquinone/menaquinone biosynthesis C-methylase UbiE
MRKEAIVEGVHVAVVPTFFAEVVAPGSPSHAEARRLQADRFATACRPGEHLYLETVEYRPGLTIPIVVRRRQENPPEEDNEHVRDGHTSAQVWPVASQPRRNALVGAIRLELSGASIIESVVSFVPGSPSALTLAQRRFAELGGFATVEDLDREEALDVVDTMASAIVAAARRRHIDSLWIFPRKALMPLFLATIDGVLPPYRFSLCRDVAGWVEESDRLQAVRDLEVKGLEASPDELPVVFQTTVETLAQDVTRRLALRDKRLQQPNLQILVLGAVRQAYRAVRAELNDLNSGRGVQQLGRESLGAAPQTMRTLASSVPAPQGSSDAPDGGPSPDVASASHAAADPTDLTSFPQSAGAQGFLPFAADRSAKAAYLDAFLQAGGDDVTTYKQLAFDLLDIGHGVSVLDVGCGGGVDLVSLAKRVGPRGRVIGLDHDADLVATARAYIASQPKDELPIVPEVCEGDAERMSFADATFDRVRADRMLQHVKHPARALSEMFRVLRPNGVVTLVEPDWRAIAFYPASPSGGNDDRTFAAVLGYYQRHLPQALIGRQLLMLLRRLGEHAWESVHVRTIAFTLTSWARVDLVLQLSNAARALAAEEPASAAEIEEWLAAVARSAAAGEFLASIPLLFAWARKAG